MPNTAASARPRISSGGSDRTSSDILEVTNRGMGPVEPTFRIVRPVTGVSGLDEYGDFPIPVAYEDDARRMLHAGDILTVRVAIAESAHGTNSFAFCKPSESGVEGWRKLPASSGLRARCQVRDQLRGTGLILELELTWQTDGGPSLVVHVKDQPMIAS